MVYYFFCKGVGDQISVALYFNIFVPLSLNAPSVTQTFG